MYFEDEDDDRDEREALETRYQELAERVNRMKIDHLETKAELEVVLAYAAEARTADALEALKVSLGNLNAN